MGVRVVVVFFVAAAVVVVVVSLVSPSNPCNNPIFLSIVAQDANERSAKKKKRRAIIFPTEIGGELRASASAELFTLHPYHLCDDACVTLSK